jgi:hypothetical protein
MTKFKVPSIITICPHGYSRTTIHLRVRSIASICYRIPVDSKQEIEIPSHGIFTTDVDEYLLRSGVILGVCKTIRVVHKTKTMTSTEAANCYDGLAVDYFFAMCTTGQRMSVIMIGRVSANLTIFVFQNML